MNLSSVLSGHCCASLWGFSMANVVHSSVIPAWPLLCILVWVFFCLAIILPLFLCLAIVLPLFSILPLLCICVFFVRSLLWLHVFLCLLFLCVWSLFSILVFLCLPPSVFSPWSLFCLILFCSLWPSFGILLFSSVLPLLFILGFFLSHNVCAFMCFLSLAIIFPPFVFLHCIQFIFFSVWSLFRLRVSFLLVAVFFYLVGA